MRKTITIHTHYIATDWGVREIPEGGLMAFVRFVRSDSPEEYSRYGNDADAYEEFEKEGFIKTRSFTSYEACYEWLKENAEDSISSNRIGGK